MATDRALPHVELQAARGVAARRVGVVSSMLTMLSICCLCEKSATNRLDSTRRQVRNGKLIQIVAFAVVVRVDDPSRAESTTLTRASVVRIPE